MTGLDRTTVSPSSSSMMRSTPWVDGCCGPMLMIMVCSSAGTSGGFCDSASEMRSTESASRSSACSTGIGHPLELHRDGADRVVLAQRVPLPLLGHEDAGHVGVAVEADAEHVEHLALQDLGAGVDV